MIQFKLKKLREKFKRDGFVKIDLLNKLEVEQLRNLYFDHKAEHISVDEKMHSTTDTEDLNLILKLDREVKKIVLPRLEEHIQDLDCLLSSFLVKESGENSETGFHQDPTLVHPNEYVSANVWVALQDTERINGNLLLLKGSHRIVDCIVVTPDFPPYFKNFRNELIAYATEVPAKAGQTIIFDNKLVHGATPNFSGKERIASVLSIKSKPANWNFFYLQPGERSNKIEQYVIDYQSFAAMKKNGRPEKADFLGHYDYTFPILEFDEFKRFMRKNYPKDFYRTRLKQLFKA